MRQREPRIRDKSYMSWIARLPCLKCAVQGRVTFGVEVCHPKIAIAAHGWREGGLSEKIHDRRCIGLCATHHRLARDSEHMMGQRAFYDDLGICPGCLTESLNSAYDAEQPGIEVIWSAVRSRRRDGNPTC